MIIIIIQSPKLIHLDTSSSSRGSIFLSEPKGAMHSPVVVVAVVAAVAFASRGICATDQLDTTSGWSSHCVNRQVLLPIRHHCATSVRVYVCVCVHSCNSITHHTTTTPLPHDNTMEIRTPRHWTMSGRGRESNGFLRPVSAISIELAGGLAAEF